jgi:hypothetical protein
MAEKTESGIRAWLAHPDAEEDSPSTYWYWKGFIDCLDRHGEFPRGFNTTPEAVTLNQPARMARPVTGPKEPHHGATSRPHYERLEPGDPGEIGTVSETEGSAVMLGVALVSLVAFGFGVLLGGWLF